MTALALAVAVVAFIAAITAHYDRARANRRLAQVERGINDLWVGYEHIAKVIDEAMADAKSAEGAQ